MMQPESPFKMYDIRGLYPQEVSEDLARRVGRAFVAWLRGQLSVEDVSIVVGRDMRLSSESLQKAMMEGVEEVGGTVIDVGMLPTPVIFYATVTGPFHGGVVISASHNPGQYNAFKLAFHDGRELSGLWGYPEIEQLAQQDHERRTVPKRRRENPLSHYVLNVASSFTGAPKDLTVIVDYGHGMGIITMKPLLEKTGVSAHHHIETLHGKPDGSFPHHIPNPLIPKNIAELRDRVKKFDGWAIGAALDGDADRLRIIDENGVAIDSDRLACALAYYRRDKFPKSERRVFLDLRTSHAAINVLRGVDIDVVVVPVGRVHYKPLLLDKGGILAGEISGHIMFPEHFAIDDGPYALLRVLEMIKKVGKPLSEIMEPFSRGWVRREETNYDRTKPFVEILKAFEKAFSDGEKDDLDGLTLSWEDRWLNVRSSNTEPLVRVVAEARTKEKLDELVEKIESILT